MQAPDAAVLIITVTGNRAQGTLPTYNGAIQGTVSGDTLTGVRTAPDYSPAGFRFQLRDGGSRIEGQLDYAPGNPLAWGGTCANAPRK